MDKEEKIEIVKSIINNKERITDLEVKHEKLSIRIENVEKDFVEHRKTTNKIKRTVWETLNIATGNRNKVELNSHRITDTKEKFDKIEDGMKWVFRSIVGLIITIVGTVILNSFFNIF